MGLFNTIYYLKSDAAFNPYTGFAALAARLMALAMTSAANTPAVSGKHSTSHVDIAKMVSPSALVCTGRMARA